VTADEWRSACLQFSEEIADGAIAVADLDRPEVLDAVRAMPVPSKPSRLLQRAQMKRGGLSYSSEVVAPLVAARDAVLGDAAPGTPRVLVRVDEFPHYEAWDKPTEYGTERFRRFHDILTAAGVPYLVAVTPTVPRHALDPEGTDWRPHDDEERDLLAALRRDGVAFGVHGLDHRTRHANPRRHSEFVGLNAKDTETRLEQAAAIMGEEALHSDVFVAPFNRFHRRQYGPMAARWDVVTGGPESVALLGFHRTPLWRGDAVYMPAYPPFYGRASEVLDGVLELARLRAALWTPVVLHWGWEADEGWGALEELAAALAGIARPWDEFLAAVDMSRRLGDDAAAERKGRA
jgi:hypothetical protein